MRPGSLQLTYVRRQYIQKPTYALSSIRVYHFHHILRSATTCKRNFLCLPLFNLTTNQSQHIQALQYLTHAPQPINMNANSIMHKKIVYHTNHITTESKNYFSLHHKSHHINHTKNSLQQAILSIKTIM
jgi:hypothetical protein